MSMQQSTIGKPPSITRPAIMRRLRITRTTAHGHASHAEHHHVEASRYHAEQHGQH
jgi:hypothetical protein